MKKNIFFLFLTIILILPYPALRAQEMIAKPMPFLEQLPSNEILDLHQDKDGFIWLGTKNGLARYEGYQLQSFRSDFNQPRLMTDNFVWCLSEDDHSILIGTRKGVNLLDKTTYRFCPFPHDTIGNAWVHDIFVDSRKGIWVALYSDLYHCNPDYTVRKKFDNLLRNAPGNGINSIYEDHYGDIWVCTWGGGLHKYHRDTDTFDAFPRIGDHNNPFRILQDKDDRYWILTWGDGIYSFDPKAPEEQRMYVQQHVMNEKLHVPETAFFSVVQDEVYHYIWVFGYNGLYAFNVVNNHLEKVDLSAYKLDYHKMFSQLIKDREGNLWAGAYDSGYHLLMGNPAIKNNFLPLLKEKVGFDTNITTLGIDPDHGLWFNQERWGLCWYDIRHDTFYDHSTVRPGMHNVGHILRSNRSGEFWLACRDELYFYKVRLNAANQMQVLEEGSLYNRGSAGRITALYEDSKDNLWIGTEGQLYIKPADGELMASNVDLPYVVSIAEDHHGNIWLASEQAGLHTVSFTGKVNLIHSYSTLNSDLPTNNIETVITARNAVWVSTSQGSVFKLDIPSGQWQDLTRSCGMVGNSILGIKYHRHTLWILTNRQITAYDTRSDKYIHYTNLDESIQINSFKKNVMDVYDDVLYAGGHGGFVSMASLDFPSRKNQSNPVRITDVKISNHSFLFNPLRPHAGISTSRITLEPGDNNLEIFFSALQYTSTSRVMYAYWLDGVDREWVYTEPGKRSAFYNKIPKGNHVFRVKSTDEYGYWKDEITQLHVYKAPAWYETWWAYGLYAIAAVMMLYLIMYYYLHRVRLADQVRFQKELTKTKLEYFTHISHELLTPLTTIGCVAEDMEQENVSSPENIHLLKSNMLRLKRLIQQVLDFRKVENDSFVLNPTYGDITVLISEICHTGIRPIMEAKGIQFEMRFEEESIWGYMDFDKIDKVLYNLLSNAAKYTPENKKVQLSVSTVRENGLRFLEIEVADEGIGINPKEITRIFTPFYVNKDTYAPQSNGIGLSLARKLLTLHKGDIRVESTWGKGTTFTVRVPIDRECYPEMKDIIVSEGKRDAAATPEDHHPNAEGTVLLVDDNVEFLNLMKKMLKLHYNVFTATNGKDALYIVNQEDIELVVTDFMMPEMDGSELCGAIKKDISTSHIPVLMLTAKNSVEDQVKCFEAGANGYLTKPFEMKMLYARIDNLIRANCKRQKDFRSDTEINLSILEYETPDEQFLKRAVQCIEKHLIESEFDMNIFASELCVSKATLNRKIKAMTGLAPVEFVRNIRLKHACRLLKKSSSNVSDVAYTVGFSNPKYFSKCFKDEFGMIPSEYQKAVREEG